MKDLEDRCLTFAKGVRNYCKQIKFNTVDNEYIKQLVRSSASIGANYIEANEYLGQADRLMKFRISRKEAKETTYWLELLEDLDKDKNIILKKESEELRKIFSAIIKKLNQGSTQ